MAIEVPKVQYEDIIVNVGAGGLYGDTPVTKGSYRVCVCVCKPAFEH